MTRPAHTPAMGDELKPCLWCGMLGFAEQGAMIGSHWAVHCSNTDCLAIGPLRPTEAEAIERWNTRTETQSQATIDELVGALRGISPAVAAVMGVMDSFMSFPASMVSADASEESGTEITEKQALKIMRALHAFGLADFGSLYNEDEPLIAGRGYWLNKQGIAFRALLARKEDGQ